MISFAYKPLFEDYYKRWKDKLLKAQKISANEDRQKKIQQLYQEIEKNLNYLGSTAISDELQDYVPLIINDFKKANIKVWMITGDKKETAEKIGVVSNILDKKHIIFQIESTEKSLIRLTLLGII